MESKWMSGLREQLVARYDLESLPRIRKAIRIQYMENFGPDGRFRHWMNKDYFRANICVWWDMMSCPWPKQNDFTSIRSNIELALMNMNYSGTATIFAYSTVNTFTNDVLDVLRSQKIEVREVEGGKDIAGSMGVDIIFWKFDNHSIPTTLLVITDEDILTNEGDFNHVNVLIAAQEPRVRGIFKHRASSVWQWSSMAAGGLPLLKKEICY